MNDLLFLSTICQTKFGVSSPSSFGSGGKLACVVYPKTPDELVKVHSALVEGGIRHIALGACTNVLIKDEGYDGVVISTQNLKGRRVDGRSIYLLAGERMVGVCRFAMENALSGIEGLCSIPGSIGGGVIMNCGAFGRELGDVASYADILCDGEIRRYKSQDINFEYRNSSARKLGIVVGVGLELIRGDRYSIARDMKGYAIARAKSQPKGKSLGSVFKKAKDVSAGYYIDKAGLKGCKVGGAQISDIHANFIINAGGAMSSDYIMLADYARQEVDKRFGVKLKYEVEYV